MTFSDLRYLLASNKVVDCFATNFQMIYENQLSVNLGGTPTTSSPERICRALRPVDLPTLDVQGAGRSSNGSRDPVASLLHPLVDLAALHHEADVLQYGHIFQRIPGDGDQVGPFPSLQATRLLLDAEEFRGP